MHTSTAQFSRRFSEIKGLQKASIVSYYFDSLPCGTVLCVEEESAAGKKTEACICQNLNEILAANLLQLACENNFGLGTWFDLLNEQGIQYNICPAC